MLICKMFVVFQAGTEDGCVAMFLLSSDGVHYDRAFDKQESEF